uniref:Odorant receptor n=1 Tax=Phlebotomus papatasi TaxID=29031 RepID=A0A3F2ZEP4_PHLPP
MPGSTYIDSYPEFLRLERFLKLILQILKFSVLPQKIFSGSRIYLFHIYHLHFVLSLIASSLYFEKNVAMWVLTIVEFITVLQLVVKFSSIVTHEEDLNQFFLWLRQVHQLNKNESIANSTKKHFRNNLLLVQRILKFIFPVAFLAGAVFIYYLISVDTIICALPGLSPNQNQSSILHHINQILTLGPLTTFVTFYDSLYICAGFYLIAVLNIFHDTVLCLDNSELVDKKKFLKMCYLFHSKILTNLELFNCIFNNVLSAQAVSSTFYVFLVFVLFLVDGSPTFLAPAITIYSQFAALCIFGELIYAKSEKIFVALYLTKWYDFDVNEQKFLLMMMHASMKPFGFKLAGIYEINALMFIQVFKIGFSYGTILYTFS